MFLSNKNDACDMPRHVFRIITNTRKKFGAMHFIYYINRSIATKVDSTYLGYSPTAHSVYVCESWAQTSDV